MKEEKEKFKKLEAKCQNIIKRLLNKRKMSTRRKSDVSKVTKQYKWVAKKKLVDTGQTTVDLLKP